MKPRYKSTGCFRFFIFFIIFLPIVFFGAAYIRGENGVKIIKDFYHSVVGESDSKSSTQDNYDPNERIKELEKELKEANDKIKELEQELKDKK
jgi:cell shape-determining protein MreC